MRKLFIVVLSSIATLLSGCDTLFSELEITFFNMNRIGNVEMEVTIYEDLKNPTNFNIKTDGLHQVTEQDDEITFTYFNENKEFFQLIMIEELYYGYKTEVSEDEVFNLNTILELFTLAPQDFELEKDGYYRPIVMLYDFEDLEFKVVNGYITEMNFRLITDGDSIPMNIIFSNVNETELNFPKFIEFSPYENAKYFLENNDYEIYTSEVGYIISNDILIFEYTYDEEFIVITDLSNIDNEDYGTLYYYPDTEIITLDQEGNLTYSLGKFIYLYEESNISLLNLAVINDFHFGSLLSFQEYSELEPVEDTIETE